MENKRVKKKRQKRNIIEGHITTTERSGKDRSDAYFKRSRNLIKSAEDLHTITGAHVKAQVIPTWNHGVREFVSHGFPLCDIEVLEAAAPLPGGLVIDMVLPRPSAAQLRNCPAKR